MIHNRPYVNKKITVIIPCKHRDMSLYQVLPSWFTQIKQAQIAIVDYSSHSSLYTLVREICQRHKKTLAYNTPHSDADCLVLSVKDKMFFNMSHAINYAITRTTSDVISIAGCESLPAPYYLEIAANLIDDKTFTRCIRGRLTYPRQMIERINGYPELVEYWGGEDDIVASQFVENGATCLDLDYLLVRNMQTSDFHDPMPKCSNEDMNLSKQYAKQNSSIRYRNTGIGNKFQGVMKNRTAFAKYCKDYGNPQINNYGEPYGDEEPVLLRPSSEKMVVETVPEIEHPPTNPRSVTSRCAVIIPVCNRLDNLTATLPMWLSQLYQNKQIVIVDYNSEVPVLQRVKDICEGYKMSVVYNEYDSDADVVVFRMEELENFNISHAYNFAVSRIHTDVLSFVCADTCPVDYYLDLIMHSVDETNIVQLWWGLLNITYTNWERMNGHQEFLVGWGAEDTDFADRAIMMGLNHIVLPKNYCFHIPQEAHKKGVHREIKDINQSNAINTARFAQYRALRGYVGNYEQGIGGKLPVEFIGLQSELYVLHVFDYSEVDATKLPEQAKKFDDNTYYFVCKAMDSDDEAEWQSTKWQTWVHAGSLIGHVKDFITDTSEIYISKMIVNIRDHIRHEHQIRTTIHNTAEYQEYRRHREGGSC